MHDYVAPLIIDVYILYFLCSTLKCMLSNNYSIIIKKENVIMNLSVGITIALGFRELEIVSLTLVRFLCCHVPRPHACSNS